MGILLNTTSRQKVWPKVPCSHNTKMNIVPFQDCKDSKGKGETSLTQRLLSNQTATSGMTTVGAASTHSSSFNRIPYQVAQLSTAVNVNSLQQHTAMLNRTDRRALGVTPAYNNNNFKRLGTRRGVSKAPNLIGADIDWRSSFEDPRYLDVYSENHSGSKLRSFSATRSKLQDSPNGARSNPRVAAMTNSTFSGSHSNISNSGGGTPYNVSQQYACSTFPHPNVTKVTPNQPASLGLSVISGPAPIMNRTDGFAGDHGLPPKKPSNGLTNQGR